MSTDNRETDDGLAEVTYADVVLARMLAEIRDGVYQARQAEEAA